MTVLSKESPYKKKTVTTDQAAKLPALQPGQDVKFLSSDNQGSYMTGKEITNADQPRSYIVEHKGYQYLQRKHKIHTPNYTKTPSLQDQHVTTQPLSNQRLHRTTAPSKRAGHQSFLQEEAVILPKNPSLQDHLHLPALPKITSLQDHLHSTGETPSHFIGTSPAQIPNHSHERPQRGPSSSVQCQSRH